MAVFAARRKNRRRTLNWRNENKQNRPKYDCGQPEFCSKLTESNNVQRLFIIQVPVDLWHLRAVGDLSGLPAGHTLGIHQLHGGGRDTGLAYHPLVSPL